ncbi:transmembrane protein 19-like isoform X2 [Tachypleus tridentatus]|uniref:transmembrane protein 19-like isoform X2 n=1 Tax=Tachypleus tridentatus TaxID=6853 RepID=UPI003FD2D714
MILACLLACLLLISLIFWFVYCVTGLFAYEKELPSLARIFWAVSIPLVVAAWGLKGRSVSWSGAASGFLVGFLLTVSNYQFIVCLLAFFVSSSKATRFRSWQKKKYDSEFKEGGERNWVQVVCNGGVASELALLLMIECGVGERPINFDNDFSCSWLTVAVISALCGANGDTWASELGPVFSRADPILITNLRKVPKGTNGGVSVPGLLFSAFGGTLIGTSYYISHLIFHNEEHLFTSIPQWPVIIIATFAGFFGSFVDSLLGATIQFSGLNKRTGKIVAARGVEIKHISGIGLLDNHAVNLVSTLVTALLMPELRVL